MRTAAAAILTSLAAAGAYAAPAPPEPTATPGVPAKTVSPLTVVPGDRAKVVATFPAAGQVVAPGVLILKFTFDQKMLGDAFDVQAAPGGAMPSCLKTPRLLNDAKTFVLLCTTAPKTTYGLAFNATQKDGFENEGEIRAATSTLSFSTNDGDGPTDIAAAMKLEGLTEADLPIQDAPTDAESVHHTRAQSSPP